MKKLISASDRKSRKPSPYAPASPDDAGDFFAVVFVFLLIAGIVLFFRFVGGE